MSKAKSPFHRGEKEIQSRLGIEEKMGELGRRMIRDHMPQEHQVFYSTRKADTAKIRVLRPPVETTAQQQTFERFPRHMDSPASLR